MSSVGTTEGEEGEEGGGGRMRQGGWTTCVACKISTVHVMPYMVHV